MIKEKDIVIRVDEKLKKQITEKAKYLGLSVSAYVRMILKKEVENV
jgi:antitoxin component of RelBE/YafQ-DinJ toxin-antitoxin module